MVTIILWVLTLVLSPVYMVLYLNLAQGYSLPHSIVATLMLAVPAAIITLAFFGKKGDRALNLVMATAGYTCAIVASVIVPPVCKLLLGLDLTIFDSMAVLVVAAVIAVFVFVVKRLAGQNEDRVSATIMWVIVGIAFFIVMWSITEFFDGVAAFLQYLVSLF